MNTTRRGWLAQASGRPWINALSTALLAVAGVVSLPASAVPISYELDVTGLGASGTFNGTPFANAGLVLTFEGDTTTVLPFTVQGTKGPVSGYVNLVGTATVVVFEGNGTVIAQGTFLPSAGIFISVDQTNGGIGFGSFGVPPTNLNFPGQVAYPAGMLVVPKSNIATYDLKSNLPALAGFALSCVGFPALNGSCGNGIPLPTTSGDLILNHESVANAIFSARTQAVTPFASLSVEAEIATERFELQGHFSLGAASNGINPLSEAVSLQLDSYSVTIPPGSFRRTARGGYEFEGKIADVRLRFFLKAHSPSRYRLEVEGAGEGIPQLTSPLSVVLTIGDDSGTTTVTAGSGEESTPSER